MKMFFNLFHSDESFNDYKVSKHSFISFKLYRLQITLLNLEYFRRVGATGSDAVFALRHLATLTQTALDEIADQFDDNDNGSLATMTRLRQAYELLGRLTTTTVGSTVDGFANFSFGVWVGQNDTVDKSSVLAGRGNADFTATEIGGLYRLLVDAQLLGNASDQSVQSCLLPPSLPSSCRFFAALKAFTTAPPVASISNASSSTSTENLSRLISGLLCVDPLTACLPLDFVADVGVNVSTSSSAAVAAARAAYIRVIADYVLRHLSWYVISRTLVTAGEDIVVTKSQRELAIGRRRDVNVTSSSSAFVDDDVKTAERRRHCGGDGILEHYETADGASKGSCLIAVYNCYDAIQAFSNGEWAGKYHLNLLRVIRSQSGTSLTITVPACIVHLQICWSWQKSASALT